MITVIGIIVGFLILMLLVVAHEFGHFIAAKRNGVEVEEFGIGFPPRAKAWVKNPEYIKWRAAKKSGKSVGDKPKKWLKLPKSEWGKPQKTLIFSLNWLPIGGFCSMKGESDSDERPHSFGAASLWAKTKILFAGVAMNWLAAFIILTSLTATGMPTFMDNQFTVAADAHVTPAVITVGKVIENSPAERAGLKPGDQFIKVGDKNVITVDDIFNFNDTHAGETVTYLMRVDNEDKSYEVTLGEKDQEYVLGVYLDQGSLPTTRYTWSAPIVGAVSTIQLTGETYRGLGTMVGSLFSGIVKQFSGDETVKQEGKEQIGQAGDSVSGPVGIIGVLFPASIQSGPTTLAFLAAIISISLACMNVLPIPALDGGRFVLIALFRLRGKKLKKETEEKIVSRTFIFLLILIAFVTILDIIKFF